MPIEGILNLEKEDAVATMNCGNKVLTVNIAPLKRNQQIEGYVYVLHDITEQHNWMP